MAVSAAAALLDELMGRNRNLDPNESKGEVHWDDPEVCRYFLCGFCPHELFTNTRADLGPCDKMHDEAMIESYKKSSRFERMGLEEDFMRFLQSLLSDVERRIKRGHARLALNNTPGGMGGAADATREEQIEMLTARINELVDEAEQLGCEGKVEEAQGVMKLCDQLKEERSDQENMRQQPATHERGRRSLIEEDMSKRMEVCETCGALLVAGDAQQRIDEHIMGKQHMGYARIRAYVEERRKKRMAPIEEREARLAKEREEREKEREKEREQRKKLEEEKEKEREERKAAEKEKEKERERDRDRRRRSRSRSRRSRSRSHDRKRRSRSRDRRRRSRSRDRDRRRRRSRSRHRSSSRHHSHSGRSSRDRKSRDKDGSSRDKDRRSRDKDGSSRDKDRASKETDTKLSEHSNKEDDPKDKEEARKEDADMEHSGKEDKDPSNRDEDHSDRDRSHSDRSRDRGRSSRDGERDHSREREDRSKDRNRSREREQSRDRDRSRRDRDREEKHRRHSRSRSRSKGKSRHSSREHDLHASPQKETAMDDGDSPGAVAENGMAVGDPSAGDSN